MNKSDRTLQGETERGSQACPNPATGLGRAGAGQSSTPHSREGPAAALKPAGNPVASTTGFLAGDPTFYQAECDSACTWTIFGCRRDLGPQSNQEGAGRAVGPSGCPWFQGAGSRILMAAPLRCLPPTLPSCVTQLWGLRPRDPAETLSGDVVCCCRPSRAHRWLTEPSRATAGRTVRRCPGLSSPAGCIRKQEPRGFGVQKNFRQRTRTRPLGHSPGPCWL